MLVKTNHQQNIFMGVKIINILILGFNIQRYKVQLLDRAIAVFTQGLTFFRKLPYKKNQRELSADVLAT